MIRPAIASDLPEIMTLVTGLAEHHDDFTTVTEATLARDLFGPQPWLQILVATDQGLQGYTALTQLARLQWGQRGMDIHHLFVAKAYRGQGIGRALVAAAITTARAQHCTYMTVSALASNVAAQLFYGNLGFHSAPHHGIRFALDLNQT